MSHLEFFVKDKTFASFSENWKKKLKVPYSDDFE